MIQLRLRKKITSLQKDDEIKIEAKRNLKPGFFKVKITFWRGKQKLLSEPQQVARLERYFNKERMFLSQVVLKVAELKFLIATLSNTKIEGGISVKDTATPDKKAWKVVFVLKVKDI